VIPKFTSTEKVKNWVAQQRANRKRFEQLLPELRTKDGLVPTSQMVVRAADKIVLLQAPNVRIYPHWRVSGLAHTLLENPELWKIAELRILPGRSIVARAPVFGVPFEKAVEVVLKKGMVKSLFWVPKMNDNTLCSKLFVHLKRTTEPTGTAISFESWSWLDEGIEVDYTHMIMSNDAATVSHLDGAIIEYDSEATLSSIFAVGRKCKGIRKEKYFRLDGQIPVGDAILLIRSYFPSEAPVGEYFKYTDGWPDEISI